MDCGAERAIGRREGAACMRALHFDPSRPVDTTPCNWLDSFLHEELRQGRSIPECAEDGNQFDQVLSGVATFSAQPII